MMIVQPIIDCRDESFNLFKKSLENSRVIGLSVVGKNIGRDGIISWMQIDTNKQLYFLDIVSLGMDIFLELKEFFESVLIIKIIHDCRFISDFLWHKLSINLSNVFDTQTADLIIYRSANKNLLPKELKSLYECIMQYVAPAQEHLLGFRTQLSIYAENADLWFERPADQTMLKTLFNLTKYLKLLRQAQLVILLNEFYNAVDIQRAYFRDAPASDLLRLKCYPERIPIQFNNIAKHADIARKKEANNIISNNFGSRTKESNAELNNIHLSSSKSEDIKGTLPILPSPNIQNSDINENIVHPKLVNCEQNVSFNDVYNSCKNMDIDNGLTEVEQACIPIRHLISGGENRLNIGTKKLNKLLELFRSNQNSHNFPMPICDDLNHSVNKCMLENLKYSEQDTGDYYLQNHNDFDQFDGTNQYLTKKLKSILRIQSCSDKSDGDGRRIDPKSCPDDAIRTNYGCTSINNRSLNSEKNICSSDRVDRSNQHLNSALKKVGRIIDGHNNTAEIYSKKNLMPENYIDESFELGSLDILDVNVGSQQVLAITNEIGKNGTATEHNVSYISDAIGVSTDRSRYVGENLPNCSSFICKYDSDCCGQEFPNTSTPVGDSNTFADLDSDNLYNRLSSEKYFQSNDSSELNSNDLHRRIPYDECLYRKMQCEEEDQSTVIDRRVAINPLKSLYGYSVSDDCWRSKVDESVDRYSNETNSSMDLYGYTVCNGMAVHDDGVNRFAESPSSEISISGDNVINEWAVENSENVVTSRKIQNLRCGSVKETAVLGNMANKNDPFSEDFNASGDAVVNTNNIIVQMLEKSPPKIDRMLERNRDYVFDNNNMTRGRGIFFNEFKSNSNKKMGRGRLFEMLD